MITLPENWTDWVVVGELGRGSFSVVYEAERKDDPSVHCAIKVISIPQDDSEYDELIASGFTRELSISYFSETVEELTREIRLMEHFKGMPNIVGIEDYKVIPREDGIGSDIFIRMELLTSLEKYISDKTLTEKEVVQLGIDVCTALELCHDQHIIHRDIKPANIFVNDRIGAHVLYKLGDFGIARNLEGKTQNFSTKGTPNYMAPEVAANMKYNETADIYSLGLTLYWLMNNKRLPFYPQTQLYSPAAKREALQRRLSGEEPEAPVNASEALSHIILKSCKYNPEERYQNAARMKTSLKKLQATLEPPPIFSIHTEMAFGDETGKEKTEKKKPAESKPASPKTAEPKPVPPKPPVQKRAQQKTAKPGKGKRTVIWILCAVLLLCAGFALYRLGPWNRQNPPAVTETSFTAASGWTPAWFRSNPETDPGQPYVEIGMNYDVLNDDAGNETGWLIWPTFAEKHGRALQIRKLAVRWFCEGQGNVVLRDMVYATEDEIRSALRVDQLGANETANMAVQGMLPLSDPGRQKIDGIGIALFGTDSSGNGYEFRGYCELPGLKDAESAPEPEPAEEDTGDTGNPDPDEQPISQETAELLKQGDYVLFGRYYQEDREGKETEPIEWLVMEEKDGAVFLVSRYAVEVMAYNATLNGAAWADCSLRQWLNGDFLQTAFSEEEQESIRVTEVDLSAEQGWKDWNNGGRAGGSTQDRIFLLSCAEVRQYLIRQNWHLCPVTPYTASRAYKESPRIVNGRQTCDYWLRDAAYNNNAGCVEANGAIGTGRINFSQGVVRPALWVDASAVTLE